MGDFFLDKDVAKIGDSVSIKGNCVDSGAVFQSDNPSVAVIDPYTGTGIQAVGIGTANISEATYPSPICSNTGSIEFSVTEDGKPFFMPKSEFLQYNEFEVVFIFGLLFVAFLIRFAKRS